MAIKDKLEELIGTIRSCSTKDGVAEIEKLYAQKKKELGANITPMMDIRVRDAIRGRHTQFDNEAAEAKEMAKMKKQEDDANAIAAKMESGLFVTSEKEFFLHETVLDACAIDAACIMEVSADIPTNGHIELYKTLSEAAVHVGATAKMIIPPSRNRVLSDADRVRMFESMSNVDVETKCVMFAEVERMIARGQTRVFALVESEKIAEYRRLGQHFLRVGGLRFEIVEVKNKIPSSVVEQFIANDDLDSFMKNVSLPMQEAERMFDRHLEVLMESGHVN
ncbi:ATP-dependent DNA helicase [Vibrio phage 1.081.O._10N.286.52.C2]|nr:ATP-dependent DNA helicase [Vibrio phage 1.081.O._10N.286.52.C2]